MNHLDKILYSSCEVQWINGLDELFKATAYYELHREFDEGSQSTVAVFEPQAVLDEHEKPVSEAELPEGFWRAVENYAIHGGHHPVSLNF